MLLNLPAGQRWLEHFDKPQVILLNKFKMKIFTESELEPGTAK